MTNSRRKQQYKLGTVARKESRRHQKSTDNLIPNRPFQRLVDEVAVGLKKEVRSKPLLWTLCKKLQKRTCYQARGSPRKA
ncbi:hypothetical protein KC318_g5628 [Hortaea werneckii]|nr:hypothetical protein KC334_g5783 [Hortaea werneckii]KAI7011441.1 hypothetical protein KC355_g5772 [Hortaea werneckii]KAI7667817.1 hypothetical protein KC318_g5628 [Hortaea werneckii]